jgi:L-aspartate oxidase
MARDAGLLRSLEGLHDAISALLRLASGRGATADPAIVGLMIAVMALQREESRGAHWRIDFPQRAPAARRATLRLADAIATARELDERFSPTARRA